jgi:outer membrane protein assembly factor BamB
MKSFWLCFVLAASLHGFGQDAAMFRGNLAHTGIYRESRPTKSATVAWKFHTADAIFSSPAVADGVIYFGSGDNNFYALNLDGTLKWKFRTDSRVSSSPAVSEGTVFFGSWDGNFYAVDCRTGKVKWKFKTTGERRFTATHIHGSQPAAESMPDPFDVYLSSPAVWKKAVYFGSGDGNIYSLEEETGILKWKFKTGDVVHASPAIADGTLFIGSWDSFFYALDALTGQEKWRFQTGRDAAIHNQEGIQSSAAVEDGTVYFGCRDSNFYALDATSGKQKWKFNNKGSWVISSPAVRDGKVYFATSDTGMLYAFDAKTGTQTASWSSNHWPMFSSPAIAGNTLYIGSELGKLMAVNLQSGAQSWILETDGQKANGATYTKGDGTPNYESAFASDFYDDLVAGFAKMRSVGSIFSSPTIADGVVYVGSTDGNLYALK